MFEEARLPTLRTKGKEKEKLTGDTRVKVLKTEKVLEHERLLYIVQR